MPWSGPHYQLDRGFRVCLVACVMIVGPDGIMLMRLFRMTPFAGVAGGRHRGRRQRPLIPRENAPQVLGMDTFFAMIAKVESRPI